MRTKYGLIAKVRWLAKGNPETMPHLSDLNYHQHMTLWVRPCVSIHKYSFFSLLINTLFYYFPSLCGNSFLQSCWARGLSLATVPGALVVRIYRSHCCSLTSISGWETEILFQAAAGWGHSRSVRVVLCIWGCDLFLSEQRQWERQEKWWNLSRTL